MAQVSIRGVIYRGVIAKGVNVPGHIYQGVIVPGVVSYIHEREFPVSVSERDTTIVASKALLLFLAESVENLWSTMCSEFIRVLTRPTDG